MKRHDLATLEHRLPPLNPRAAAKILGVCPETVIAWCKRGKIAASRTPGGHWLIARSVVAEYLPDETPEQFETERQRNKRDDEAMADIEAL